VFVPFRLQNGFKSLATATAFIVELSECVHTTGISRSSAPRSPAPQANSRPVTSVTETGIATASR
jgi:hypothetical protein